MINISHCNIVNHRDDALERLFEPITKTAQGFETTGIHRYYCCLYPPVFDAKHVDTVIIWTGDSKHIGTHGIVANAQWSFSTLAVD